jgi:CheY-like chemotaxis protein
VGDAPEAKRQLHVLCLEDSPLDAELTAETLRHIGKVIAMDVAQDRQEYERLLGQGDYDIILADYSLPGYDAHGALELAQAMRPDTPFICVSGAIGEEATAELLKQGADDCVLKDRMARLPHAVERAIDVRARRRAIVESEHRFRSLFENLLNGYAYCRIIHDETGRPVDWVYLDVNPAFERITGLSDVVGRSV